MITHPDGTTTPVIDASVHIFSQSNKDLRSFMREPFKSRGFPDYEMDWYGAPGGEYLSKAEGRTGSIQALTPRSSASTSSTRASPTSPSCTR